MHLNFKKALVLAPHTDDAEFGCGGTINKLTDNGCEVYSVAFSACPQSVLPQFPSDILITEVKAASTVLGIRQENLFLFEFEIRKFNSYRQEILDEILKLKKLIEPDVVFIPCVTDIHQDHSIIANEGIRAFKFKTILCYELPWNNFNFNTSCFFKLSEKNVKAKVDAINEYKSQAHRYYAGEEFIRSLAITRGVQINTRYAEAFEVVRVVN